MKMNKNDGPADGFGSFPAVRANLMKTAVHWIEGKKLDDDCGDLWRVHNKLYDLSDFISSHPGGGMWLQVTRGTDITEAFESSHLDANKVDAILAKFYRKEAPTTKKRQSPFTFQDDGFYRTLKKRANLHLKQNVTRKDQEIGRQKVKTVQNRLLFVFAALVILSAQFCSYSLALLAGFAMFFNIILAHNFLHRNCMNLKYNLID